MVFSRTKLAAPRDQKIAFVRFGLLAVEHIRAEPGCVACQLYRDVGSDETYVVVSEWSSLIMVQRHLQGQAYRKMLELMEMSSRPCDVSFHTIRNTHGMELVDRALAKADDRR